MKVSVKALPRLSYLLGLGVLALGFILISHGVVAAEKPQPAQKIGQSKYEEQAFPLHGAAQLNVIFRYTKGKLQSVYFWNLGKPLQVNIFSKNHVMGTKDDLLVPAPNVNQFVIKVSPYDVHGSTTVAKGQHAGKNYMFAKGKDGIWVMHSYY